MIRKGDYFKYVKLLVIILMVVSFIKGVNIVNASEAVTITQKSGHIKDPNGNTWYIYIAKTKGGKIFRYMYAMKPFVDKNGNYYYCVQPNVPITDGLNSQYLPSNDDAWKQLKDYYGDGDGKLIADGVANEERIKLIMYYGYGYSGRTSEWWYTITQLMIWKELYPTEDIGFASTCTYDSKISCTKTTKYDKYFQEIENDIKNHNLKPSIDNKEINNMLIGEKKNIIDKNKVLSNYSIESCLNCIASINGNEIEIEATDVGEIKLLLKRKFNKYKTKKSYILASSLDKKRGQGNSIQKVASRADPNDISLELVGSSNYITSKIIVEKVDGKIQGDISSVKDEARLKGATICLYKSDNTKIKCLVSDGVKALDFGTYEKGEYYLLEEKAPEGYVKSNVKYEVTVSGFGDDIFQIIKNDRTSTFTLFKVGKDNKPLSNAYIDIYYKNDELFYSGITNEEGILEVKNIKKGEYYYVEKKAPEGYGRDKEKHYFTITSDGNCFFTDTLKNESTQVEITKTDISTSKAIPGATIAVYQLQSDGTWKEYFKDTTSSNGKIVIENIPYGKYYFIELEAPKGYILNDEKHYFTIDDNGYIYKSDLPNEKYSHLYLKKTDLSKANVIEGATIEIYRINDDESETLIYTGITDEEGKIEYDLLVKGKYYFRETNAPEGYILDDSKHYFEINEGGIIIDEAITNEKESIVTFEKRDLTTEQLLEGAKICVYKENDELINCIDTNQDGIGKLNLGIGKYYYMETVAPEGYDKIETKVPFEIEEEGSELTLTVYDELIIRLIPRTGINNKNIYYIGLILLSITCFIITRVIKR